MISILSECQIGKEWNDRVKGVVLLCKKMTSLHPAHILRYRCEAFRMFRNLFTVNLRI